MMRSAMMLWPEFVVLLALVMYLGTLMYCGHQRRTHRIPAPAISGHPAYERALRIQQNTLENLVVFVPACLLFSALVNPLWGAILGAVWIAARILYAVSYARAPESRGPGYIISFVVLVILLGGALVQALLHLPR